MVTDKISMLFLVQCLVWFFMMCMNAMEKSEVFMIALFGFAMNFASWTIYMEKIEINNVL